MSEIDDLVERLREVERTCLEMAGAESFAGLRTAWLERGEAVREAADRLAAPVGERDAIKAELLSLARWIGEPGNINRDDAIDEMRRVLHNRVIALSEPSNG